MDYHKSQSASQYQKTQCGPGCFWKHAKSPKRICRSQHSLQLPLKMSHHSTLTFPSPFPPGENPPSEPDSFVSPSSFANWASNILAGRSLGKVQFLKRCGTTA